MYKNLPTVSFPHSDMTMMVNPAVFTSHHSHQAKGSQQERKDGSQGSGI